MANTLPTDTNGIVYEGLRDATGAQFVAKQAGTVTTDGGGIKSAPELVTLPAFTDATTNGALAANNATLALACGGGQATALFQITGTFVGTILFQASADGGTTWVALEAVSGVTVGTSTTAPGDWFANIAGYTNVQAKMSPYTSGSASVRLNLSAQPQVVTLANAQPLGQQLSAESSSVVIASDQVVPQKGAFTEIVGQSPAVVNAVNTDLIPATDVSAYKAFALQLSGTWSATLAFQGSNDNVNWVSVEVKATGGYTGSAYTTAITSADGIWFGLITYRYLRVRVTSFTSNASMAGTLELYANAIALPVYFANVTLIANSSGTTNNFHLVAAASTNATSIKTAHAVVYSFDIFNAAAAPRYVKLYNKASAPTVGTDTPLKTIGVPAGGHVNFASALGMSFTTGLALAITTGIADTDATAVAANDVVVDLDYL